MSGGLDRLVRLFVAPAPDDASTSARPRPAAGKAPVSKSAGAGDLLPAQEAIARRGVTAACVAVLCRPGEAAALGAAVALALLRGSPARSGLICAWPASAISSRRPSAPARPVARRLQAALTARGLEARVAGPLALALLPPDPDAAALAARRAAAVARGPVVHVLAGARAAALTPLLHDADRVLIAGRDADPICVVALANLAAEGLDACCVAAPEPGLPRALAAAYLGVPQATRAALAPALKGLA